MGIGQALYSARLAVQEDKLTAVQAKFVKEEKLTTVHAQAVQEDKAYYSACKSWICWICRCKSINIKCKIATDVKDGDI